MPTPLEKIITILSGIDKRLDQMDERLTSLEHGDDLAALDNYIDGGGGSEGVELLGRSKAVGTEVDDTEGEPDPLPSFPAEWHSMTEEQQQAWISANTGVAPPAPPEPETQTIMLADGVAGEFPVPTPEAKEAWAQIAPSLFEHLPTDYGLSQEQMIDAYSKGGPLWLAAYDHDWLMQMPYGWRQDMVRQVNSYAPVDGGHLGRDILRHPTGSAETWAYSDALGVADERLVGRVRGK